MRAPVITARGKLRNHPDIRQEAEYRSPKDATVLVSGTSVHYFTRNSTGAIRILRGGNQTSIFLEVIPPSQQVKKLNTLGKINKSSWICQRSEVTGPTAAPTLERQVGGHGEAQPTEAETSRQKPLWEATLG